MPNIILTIRTDKPEAELGLFKAKRQLQYYKWPADHRLAETIHLKIKHLLDDNKLSLKDLNSIVVFKGPGSFTGLRIGLSVANALASSLEIPIVAATGDQWIERSQARLDKGENEKLAIPEYGSPPHITLPKK